MLSACTPAAGKSERRPHVLPLTGIGQTLIAVFDAFYANNKAGAMPRLCYYLPACLVPAFYQCSYPENPHRRHNNQYPGKDIVPGKSISDSRRSTHKRHCDTKNHTIHSDIFSPTKHYRPAYSFGTPHHSVFSAYYLTSPARLNNASGLASRPRKLR